MTRPFATGPLPANHTFSVTLSPGGFSGTKGVAMAAAGTNLFSFYAANFSGNPRYYVRNGTNAQERVDPVFAPNANATFNFSATRLSNNVHRIVISSGTNTFVTNATLGSVIDRAVFFHTNSANSSDTNNLYFNEPRITQPGTNGGGTASLLEPTLEVALTTARTLTAAFEPEPATAIAPADSLDTHAELLSLKDRIAVAGGVAALAATQSRVNPELSIAATRDRGAYGESYQQTLTVGVRVPFGAGPRQDARVAAARAEAVELEAQMALERARVASEVEAAHARTDAARTQLAAAERRAQLARESRGFFDTSFRLGESDLPTRLRIETEAADAERQAVRARIELAAAISGWRQALGLLPQ